jgi:thiamine-monophosphate kinase
MARFAAGLGEAQAAFGCHLIGGDTDRIDGALTVSITAIGEVPAGRMVRRGTAKAGDVLFVTGTLGDAALGLAHLRDDAFAAAHGLTREEVDYLAGRYLRPSPRLEVSALLREFASAAMDLSDGLAKDLGRMCEASGVAARVQITDIPLSPAARKCGTRAMNDALSAGDDYEILIAVPVMRAAAFAEAAGGLPFAVTRIGEVSEGAGVRILAADGSDIHLATTGWDHF